MKYSRLMNVPDSVQAPSGMNAQAHYRPMAAEVVRAGRSYQSRLTWDGVSRQVQEHPTLSAAIARANALQVSDWEADAA